MADRRKTDSILILRSGRHLMTALAALERSFPGSRLSVLTQPGTDAELSCAAVPEDARFVYSGGRFSPFRLVVSGLAAPLRRARFTRVAVLWNSDDGAGQSNATATAALLGASPLLAVTPDGTVLELSRARSVAIWLQEKCARRWSRAFAWWRALGTRVEGAELNPPLWHSHFLSDWARQVPSLAASLTGRVLDIGSGTGLAGRFLRTGHTTYLPTDLPTGRSSANGQIATDGCRPLVHCSGGALPFASSAMDGVMTFSVLEHVPDPEQILREAYRVLRPGGRLLVVTPYGFPFHGEPNDFRRWTTEGLALEARRAGFVVLETRRIGSSLSAVLLNLHLIVKYEFPHSRWWVVRTVPALFWPAVLMWQGCANLLAVCCDGAVNAKASLPIAVAVLAERSSGHDPSRDAVSTTRI